MKKTISTTPQEEGNKMKITVTIRTESGIYEMTADNSDQFDSWTVDQNSAGDDAEEVSEVVGAAIYEHFKS